MAMTKEAVYKNLKRKDVIVLNVLPEDDFLKLHIQFSHHFPLFQNRGLFSAEVEKRFGKDKFFITYSADITCAAAQNAALALKARGLGAQAYPGGLREWFEAGLPVEGTQAKHLVPSR
jgi:rhodanese-related sulfurtransferase